MTQVRVTAVGRGVLDAELLEDRGAEVLVRFVESGKRGLVGRTRVSGLGRGSNPGPTPKARANLPAAPALPPMMTGAELERRQRDVIVPPATRPFEPGTRAVPKPPKPARSERYLAFVRTKPCLITGRPGPSSAHHHGPRGMGEKTDDYRTIPLCHEVHMAFHAGRCPELTDEVAAAAMVELLLEYGRSIGEDSALVGALVEHLRTAEGT